VDVTAKGRPSIGESNETVEQFISISTTVKGNRKDTKKTVGVIAKGGPSILVKSTRLWNSS